VYFEKAILSILLNFLWRLMSGLNFTSLIGAIPTNALSTATFCRKKRTLFTLLVKKLSGDSKKSLVGHYIFFPARKHNYHQNQSTPLLVQLWQTYLPKPLLVLG
jgi:hypothetical protein